MSVAGDITMTTVTIQDIILAEVAKSGPIYTDDLAKAVGLPKLQVVWGASHVRRKGLIRSNRANINTPCRYAVTNAGRIKLGMPPVEEISPEESRPDPDPVSAAAVPIPENPLDLAFQIEAIAKLAQDIAEEKEKARVAILLKVEKSARSNAISRAQTKAKNHSETLKIILATPGLRTYEIAKAAGRNDSTIRGILREMESEGKILSIGNVKVARWVAS